MVKMNKSQYPMNSRAMISYKESYFHNIFQCCSLSKKRCHRSWTHCIWTQTLT